MKRIVKDQISLAIGCPIIRLAIVDSTHRSRDHMNIEQVIGMMIVILFVIGSVMMMIDSSN